MDSSNETTNQPLMNGQVETLPNLREAYSERLISPGIKDGVRQTQNTNIDILTSFGRLLSPLLEVQSLVPDRI